MERNGKWQVFPGGEKYGAQVRIYSNQEIKAIFIGVDGEPVEIWEKETGITNEELYNQFVYVVLTQRENNNIVVDTASEELKSTNWFYRIRRIIIMVIRKIKTIMQ